MFKTIFRKLKPIGRCFHSKITIEKQCTFHFDVNNLQLVIVRRRLQSGAPLNTVWIIGPHKHILHKLYHWSGNPNHFGKRYGVHLKTYNYWIDIRNHHDLYSLCRKCKIKKIVLIQLDLHCTEHDTAYFI